MAVGNILSQNLKTSEIEKKMLLKKIKEMQNLPMPSANVMKVMLLLRDEDVKMYHLIPAIEKDQVLVAQILKLINSGYYGLRKTIDSVERAVNLLGILNIKHIVYSASIMELFSDDEKIEWDHAYSSSVLMSSILKENEIPAESNLPLSMLMHDIGKVVLRRFSPKKYQMVLAHSATNDKIPSFKVEEALFQLTHADAAAILMEKWEMTEELIKPVTYHHREDVPEDYIMETCLLQFVNWVDCTARGILCLPPSRELLAAAGFEEIDKTYWVDYQRKFIENLEGEQKKEKHISSGTLERPPKEPKAIKAPPVTVPVVAPVDVEAENEPVEEKPLSDKELEFLKRMGKTPVQAAPKAQPPPKAVFDVAASVPVPEKTNDSTDLSTVVQKSDTAKVDRNAVRKKSADSETPHPTEKTKRILHEEPKGFWSLIKSFFGLK